MTDKKSDKENHNLVYIMNPNCGWCKKADPVVEELRKDGYEITILNVTDKKDAKEANEIQSKHSIRCGTPLFVDAETGNMVCGFKEKDVLEKWAKGEKVIAPKPKPRPNSQGSNITKRLAKLDYVWLDGYDTKNLRSKTRYMTLEFGSEENPLPFDKIIEQVPEWSFDGSSTEQADVSDSDLVLKPVRFFGNPFSNNQRGNVSYIVLCEVFNSDGTPHKSNTRAKLRDMVNNQTNPNDFWFGVEQEYSFMDPATNKPADWNIDSEPQGKYYCGVGSNYITNAHRQVSETHAQFCIQSGISLSGTNAEVMKSQWEYQIGPVSAISCADQLWVSRYILERLAEVRDMYVSFDPKVVDSSDWNGAGCHINFSTKTMREDGGEEYISDICDFLGERHEDHMSVYGVGNEKRLTGSNETANIEEFTWKVMDRGASVRVPVSTINNEWKGYIEDRRPSANVDPYEAFFVVTETVSLIESEELVMSE